MGREIRSLVFTNHGNNYAESVAQDVDENINLSNDHIVRYPYVISKFALPTQITQDLIDLNIQIINESVDTAKVIPQQKLHKLVNVLNKIPYISLIGPVICCYRKNIESAAEYGIDNFLKHRNSSRHLGPNKLFVNLGNEPMTISYLPVAIDQLSKKPQYEELLPTNNDSFSSLPFHSISHLFQPIELSIEPNSAVLIPTENVYTQFNQTNEWLVVKSFFHPKPVKALR